MFGPSKLLRDPTFDGRIPNPVAVVQHYWPSRAHAPSFAYTKASGRYRRRPLAVGGLGLDVQFPAVTEVPPYPCQHDGTTEGVTCPTGGWCCSVSREWYPEVGLPSDVCASERDCLAVMNQLERAHCALHPELTLTSVNDPTYGEVLYCERPFDKVEGQIPEVEPTDPVEPPVQPSTPPKAAMTSNEKLVMVGAATLSVLGLLYLARR